MGVNSPESRSSRVWMKMALGTFLSSLRSVSQSYLEPTYLKNAHSVIYSIDTTVPVFKSRRDKRILVRSLRPCLPLPSAPLPGHHSFLVCFESSNRCYV